MARNRFIKTYSNYVIKDIHQTTNIGTIYERDFMTISDLNSYAPGSLPAYGLNGFKMVVRDGVNLKKKHHYGNWLKNDACGKKNMYWTLQCMDEIDVDNDDVVLKPNLNSVLDFACYGSTTKMIESSIKNIINTYPAELYFTDVEIKVGNEVLYLVDNPFNIEIDKYVISENTQENTLRNFSNSYSNYAFYDADLRISQDLSWDMYVGNQANCPWVGENRLSMIDLGTPFENSPKILLFYYFINGEKVLLHDGSYIGGKITPKNNIKRGFFNGLSYFEKVLLNKKTNYTALLDTPQETKNGNVMYKRPYTWPKTNYGDWNIDVTSSSFFKYFDSLLKIGEFYDKYFSDNIWRSLTHEAIINFDWTLTKVDGNGVVTEEESPNSDRMKSFIYVAGRQFDEIKQYVDGISNANAITYDENQNKPDAFLADELSNYGWDVKSPLGAFLKKYSTGRLYPSHSDGYTVKEANYEFFRRLLLNSNAILSAKGTKRSIEMIMAMFGYYSLNFIEHSYHEVLRDGKLKTLKWEDLTDNEKKELLRYSYDMTEYVYVANEESTIWEENAYHKVQELNQYKINYDFNNLDKYQGLPLKEVSVINGENNNSYLIPWFDKKYEYDADIYFESKGGWGLKQTTIGQFSEYNEVVIDTNDDLKVYDETVKYLRFVHTINDLLTVYGEYPENNDIYYVYDITGQNQYDWGYISIKDGDKQKSEPLHTMSHYFIIKDINYDTTLGVLRNNDNQPILVDENATYDDNGNVINCGVTDEFGIPVKKYGWKNISEEELSLGISEDAKRVYYLESIVENNKGNNPHGGKGRYDNGNTYKEFFEDVFKGAKDNESFMEVSDDYLTDIYGFNLSKQIDNVKCWYFSDTLNEEHTLLKLGNDINNLVIGGYEIPIISSNGNDFVRSTNTRGEYGDSDYENVIFSSKQYPMMEPYNMENGEPEDEAAANSIINSKQFYIEFVPDMVSPDGMYDFIENSMMHYVKQVIPSTTILKYYVPMRSMDVNCYHSTYLQSAIINN